MIDKLKSKTLYNEIKDEQIVLSLFKSDIATYDIMIDREYHKNDKKIRRVDNTFSSSEIGRAEEKFDKLVENYYNKEYKEVVM